MTSGQAFQAQWRGDVIFSHGTSSARGVCISFRPNIEKQILSPPICNNNGHYIIVYMEIQGSPFVVINCHAPNTESTQVKFFKEISTKLGTLDFGEDAQFILVEDWNSIFGTFLYSLGGKQKLSKRSIFQLMSLMEDFELSDVWRTRNPSFRQFTWRCKSPLTMSHLDCFLISDTLQFSVHSCEMLNPLQIDHSPIKIKLKSLNAVKGKGYWKFSNSVFDDNIFVQNMKCKINETIPVINSYNDPRVGWEYFKYKMREYAREMAIKNARKRKRCRIELEQRVLDLEMNMTDNLPVEEIADYSTTKLELEKFMSI